MLAVIVNRNSGPKQSRRARDRALQARMRPGDLFFFTRDLDELDAAVVALREHGVTRVAVVGGDGTLSGVCTALHRHYDNSPLPTIVPLRGGTMNTIARSLGATRGKPAERLARAQRKELRLHECGTLNVADELGFLFSSGIMASYLSEYYASMWGSGPVAAAAVLARGAASVVAGGRLAARLEQRVAARVALDGACPGQAADYLLIGAGTVAEVGLGFRPFARATADSEAFHAIGHTGSLSALLRGLPHLARGDGAAAGLTLDHLCHELRIEHESPLTYALDGELRQSMGPTVLRSGPRLRFLV